MMFFNGDEEKLACLVAKAHWTSSEEEKCKMLVGAQNFSWQAFWSIVSFNGISLLAAQKLSSHGCLVPPHIADHVRKTREHNQMRRDQFLRVLVPLNRLGIPVYLLKGSLLGEVVYRDPFYKKMNDIDILIPQEHVLQAVPVFEDQGFRFVGDVFGKKKVDFRLHHSPPLISADGCAVIGLHWGLASKLAKRHPRGDIFEGTKLIDVSGLSAHSLSIEINLLHLCIHLPFFKIGLRELADVANLIIYGGEKINWNWVFASAKAWNAQDAVYRVLQLADAVLPCLPQAVREQLAKLRVPIGRSQYIQDTDKRAGDIGLLLRSRSVYVAKIEKHFVLFKLAKSYIDKAHHLKAQWNIFLFVPREEQERLLGERILTTTWRSSLRATRALWFALAQDLGVFFLSLITIKNHLSLLKAGFYALWRKQDSSEQVHMEKFQHVLEHIE